MIKFTEFKETDLKDFVENKFCKQDGDFFDFSNPALHKYTMWRDNTPIAMICFAETKPKEWGGFFIIAESFNTKDCRPLRQFVGELMAKHDAEKVWTVSRQEPELVHWHRFFGMVRESTMEIGGKECDVWSLQWE